MARASRFVGFVPVGFLAAAAILAAATVAGGWSVKAAPKDGYGVSATSIAAPEAPRLSRYGIDEVEVR